MRFRIFNKIPPAVLALFIVSLVLLTRNATPEDEEEEMKKRSVQMEIKENTKQDTKENEKPKEITGGKDLDAPENTLQKIQQQYNENIRKAQENNAANNVQQEEKKAEKDVQNVAKVNADNTQNNQAIAGDKQDKPKPPVQNIQSVEKETKIEPKKQNEIKPVNVPAPVKLSVNANKDVQIVNEIAEYKKAIEADADLQSSKDTFKGIVTLAKDVLSSAPDPKILLLAFVHEDNAVFANNWLCNTQVMDIHSSLIIVTYGSESKEFLSKKWPRVTLYPLEPDTPEANLRGLPLTIKKLQIIYVLLNAGVNVLLLDVESVWFSNPVPGFKAGDKDMMVNMASTFQTNTGFIVLFATQKNKHFWGSLYLKVKQFENKPELGIESQYDKLLKMMTKQRFGNVTLNELPGESYVEGMWYELPSEERQKTRPIVIRNNNLMGFAKRIRRAVSWKHWFIVEEGNCDLKRVSNVVKTVVGV
ncbi:uncharacterized protein LOC132718402 [Ruditapes philippinarum]|uniref:uncharacterized protein LOC132718402 n=1 Tax=Ruditapes philippinarum TaxID=129788 RepID=UPI00295B3179|nr:uncharacterized protein LOC132718402 [Ruditapes philippinarum]